MHIKRERRCCVCRSTKQQKEMIRVAKINDEFYLDLNQKLDGRGAYVCDLSECLLEAKKRKALNRTFKCDVGNEIYVKLEEYAKNK